MKPVRALTPADFPGYDAEKVRFWLEEVKREDAILWACYALVLGFTVLLLAMERRLLFVPVLAALAVPFLVLRPSRRLQAELQLTPEAVNQARRGELAAHAPPAQAPSGAEMHPQEVHA